jgi:ABC-type nitrate/sulfonate/bicarbonate transport system substrate-binding protein
MKDLSRRDVLRVAGGVASTAAWAGGANPARAQATSASRKARKLLIGRQPISGAGVAITRYMMDTKSLEAEAARFGYDLTVDWRDFPNAGPMMELLKTGPEAMSFAFVGNTPVVTGIANDLPLQVVTTGEGTQPFFFLVRPNSDIRKMENLKGKTIGTFVGLDPQNALIQALSAELGATPADLAIRFQNFPEFPTLARLPRGIDAAGMIPWSPAYTSIAQGHAVALFDTRGLTGPAHERGAGHRLAGLERSPFRPEGFYQYRPFWIAHSDILKNDPDLVLAWIIAYQKGLNAIRQTGEQKVAEANQNDWRQPPDIGRGIISADLLWKRGWVWLCEGDLVSVVAASRPLAAARNIPRPVTWDVMKEHLAAIAPLQRRAWEETGRSPPLAEFERPDSELSDLRGLPVWEAAKWGRYVDRG